MDLLEAACTILKEAGDPLPCEILVERILEAGLWTSHAELPAEAVAAQLADCMQDANSPVVMTTPGICSLRNQETPEHETAASDWTEDAGDSLSPASFPEPGMRMAAQASPSAGKSYNFADCAEMVLKAMGGKTPMRCQKIVDEAMKRGWLTTQGKTPARSMFTALLCDIKKSWERGERPRFVKSDKGLFALNTQDSPPPPPAPAKSQKDDSLTLADCAEKVLKAMGGKAPMHYGDITRKALDNGWLKPTAKILEAAMHLQILMEIMQAESRDEKHRFVLSGKGMIALSPDNIERSMPSVADHVLKLLEARSDQEPMHCRNIAEEALKQGWLTMQDDADLATSLRDELLEANRLAENRGETPPFVLPGDFMVALSSWSSEGILRQISQHNEQVRKALHARLCTRSSSDFETLVALLLRKMGFADVHVTQRTRDGGIDVQATDTTKAGIPVPVAVQAKRWKKGNNVQVSTVRELRGSLKSGAQGIIVTTSDFTSDARKEAQQPGMAAIRLISGDELVKSLIEHGIGISISSQEIYTLDVKSLPGEQE